MRGFTIHKGAQLRRVTKVDDKVRMIDIEMISFMKAAFGIPHLEDNQFCTLDR